MDIRCAPWTQSAHAHDFLCAYSGETAPGVETGDTRQSWPPARHCVEIVKSLVVSQDIYCR